MLTLPLMLVSPCPRASQGYSLTELAIVGLISAMTLSIGKVQMDSTEFQGTQERLDTIRSALLLFQKKYKRYPCPTSPNVSPTNTAYGEEVTGGCDAACPVALGLTCGTNTVKGAVPFKDLKLSEEIAYDSWDGKIDYIVDKGHTVTSDYKTGSMPIIDSHGNAITASPVFGDAIFVLVSHGKGGKGAYGKSGALLAACGATGKDVENCNGDDTFLDTQYNTGDGAARYYDDLIAWHTQENVMPPAPAASADTFGMGDQHSCGFKSDGKIWYWG
jgi:hypothetical protein